MLKIFTTFMTCSVVLFSGVASLGTAGELKTYHLGDTIPNFKIRTLQGRKTSLQAIQADEKNNSSGITVLTFWCSFCGSCRRVDKPLSDLSQKYKGKVAIFALDSSAGEEARTISNVLKEKKLEMPVLIDAKGDLADLFGVKMTTTTIVIDANNVIRYWGQFQQGDSALATEAIEAVLAGKKPPQDHTQERG
ncbi:MAG: TlpA disulfide reductase family protein [Planctomycetota bacterium]|nr:TlpA disulfide reductase family protein [Planctomycetota bacterium]